MFFNNAYAADSFLLKNKAITTKDIKVYTECSEDSEIKFTLDKNIIIGVYDSGNDEWYKIDLNNKIGYAKKEEFETDLMQFGIVEAKLRKYSYFYVDSKLENKYLTANKESLFSLLNYDGEEDFVEYIKDENNLAHFDIVLDKDSIVTVIEETKDYLKIDYNGIIGYIKNDDCILYISEKANEIINNNEEENNNEKKYENINNVIITKDIEEDYFRYLIIKNSVNYIGNEYKWGGLDLENGIDCSGFTMKLYEQINIDLPHYSLAQSRCGTEITKDELKPGDLIFYIRNNYGRGNTIGHVSIYLGNNLIVHAKGEKYGIVVEEFNDASSCKYISLL